MMEQTFMTIHNLTAEANILFASESVVDILGYQPAEVQGKSCFDFFHPSEVPFARSIHSRGVLLDKAAVLHYARILARDGRYVNCECCFTIVHDVLVACTSIFTRGEKSERRALEAPQIRRIFSSSPRDPRYHMLEHLSPKFKMPPMEREPRAALILNRFTRTLTVMFATNAVATILGVRPDQVKDKSFYECIQENCLSEAIRVVESAKANDSIAYLRFWYRDPRRPEDFERGEVDDDGDGDVDGDEADGEDDEDEGAVAAGRGAAELDARHEAMDVDSDESMPHIKQEEAEDRFSFSNNGGSARANRRASGSPAQAQPQTPERMQLQRRPRRRRNRNRPLASFELEAVVSCTSDGLVVVLRRARPPIPAPHPPLVVPFDFENGLFAAPWGQQPIRPYYPPEMLYTFQAPLLPQFMPLRENVKAAGGPPLDQLMKSIRDVAVFAWALAGINGNIADTYGRGGGAQHASSNRNSISGGGGNLLTSHSADSSQCPSPAQSQGAAVWSAAASDDGDDAEDMGKGKAPRRRVSSTAAAVPSFAAAPRPAPPRAGYPFDPPQQQQQQQFGFGMPAAAAAAKAQHSPPTSAFDAYSYASASVAHPPMWARSSHSPPAFAGNAFVPPQQQHLSQQQQQPGVLQPAPQGYVPEQQQQQQMMGVGLAQSQTHQQQQQQRVAGIHAQQAPLPAEPWTAAAATGFDHRAPPPQRHHQLPVPTAHAAGPNGTPPPFRPVWR